MVKELQEFESELFFLLYPMLQVHDLLLILLLDDKEGGFLVLQFGNPILLDLELGTKAADMLLKDEGRAPVDVAW